MQRNLKQSSSLKYDSYTDDDTRWASHLAHRCATNLPEFHGEDGTYSTVQPGGRGWPIHEAQTSSKSAGTQPAHPDHNNNSEYTNTRKAYLTMVYT